MTSKLTTRVERLEAHAGASRGHNVLIVRLSNCSGSMDREEFRVIRHQLLNKIPGHEEADVIITTRDFVFRDEGEHLEPEIAEFHWQTWRNR
jgi:hypothetical protein